MTYRQDPCRPSLAAHDETPALTVQILAAVPRQTDTGWRPSKGKSKRKIDAAIALVTALDRATAPAVMPPPRLPLATGV
jgi:hypothetical protein